MNKNNLLYESMIFLKPKPVTSSPSDSTNEDALFSKDKLEWLLFLEV